MSQRCPCGTGRALADCCGPYHAGAEPPDAESLVPRPLAALTFDRFGHAAYR